MLAQMIEETGPIETGRVIPIERPEPVPDHGEILIEVKACAVCRTDVQIASGEVAPTRLPIIPGHQVVGRILAVGEDVRGWDIGQRVGVGWLARTCGRCRYCRTGRENLCERATFTGRDIDGGFADRLLAHSDYVFRLPDALGADPEVAPLLCGGVIGYRALELAGIRPGYRLGLFGFGSSARIAIQVAHARGCEVFVATGSESGQKAAREMGAAWVGGYDSPPPAPLDAAVSFAPSGDVVAAALPRLAPGATLAINAIHLNRLPELRYDWLWKERRLVSVANYTRQDAEEFLALAAAHQIRSPVEVFPLRQAGEALVAAAGRGRDRTPVIQP